MTLTLETVHSVLNELIRSIDKNVEYTVAEGKGERSEVMLNLTLRRLATTVTIPTDNLEAARSDLMRKNQLRTTIKRALDRMTFRTLPVASTKMVRAKTEGGTFFRHTPSGGRRGRR